MINKNRRERMVEIGLTVLALTSLATLAGIVFYLFREGLPVFSQVTPLKFIFGTDWYPVGDAPDFEIRYGALKPYCGTAGPGDRSVSF